MIRQQFALAVIVWLGIWASPANAGSWSLPQGEGQVIETNLVVQAKDGFDGNGKLNVPVDFSKFETSLFLEHGLADDVTLVLATSFQDLHFTSGVDAVNFTGFSETEIGIRNVLWQNGPSVLSTQASVLIAGQGETVTDADLGIGGTQYELRVLAGRSFKIVNQDAFFDTQIAWRFRGQNISDEWRFDMSAGWRPQSQWQVLAQTFYVTNAGVPNGVRSNNRLKAQASLVYDRNHKTSYQIGIYKTVFGKNVIQENAVFLSIWKRY